MLIWLKIAFYLASMAHHVQYQLATWGAMPYQGEHDVWVGGGLHLTFQFPNHYPRKSDLETKFNSILNNFSSQFRAKMLHTKRRDIKNYKYLEKKDTKVRAVHAFTKYGHTSEEQRMIFSIQWAWTPMIKTILEN